MWLSAVWLPTFLSFHLLLHHIDLLCLSRITHHIIHTCQTMSKTGKSTDQIKQ